MRRRKPDILMVLILMIGIGAVATGFAQAHMMESQKAGMMKVSQVYQWPGQ